MQERGRWLALDLVLVAVFAVIGRQSHYGSVTLGGWSTTAWPFLAGAALGWAVLVAARRPPGALSSGVVVWVCSLAGGMALRQASGQGTAVPFVVVATLTLLCLLVGSRLLARLAPRLGQTRS